MPGGVTERRVELSFFPRNMRFLVYKNSPLRCWRHRDPRRDHRRRDGRRDPDYARRGRGRVPRLVPS